MATGTPRPQPVTARPQRLCPLCGAELRPSHREYVGSKRSAQVLRCTRCGHQVRGEARDDAAWSRPPARRRELPDGGQPDNFVLDGDTAERLRQMLEGNASGAEG